MIVFCDTSALVKLYVQEEFSHEVCGLADKATALAVSRISRAENMATLARRVRESPDNSPVILLPRGQAGWLM